MRNSGESYIQPHRILARPKTTMQRFSFRCLSWKLFAVYSFYSGTSYLMEKHRQNQMNFLDLAYFEPLVFLTETWLSDKHLDKRNSSS